MGINKRKNLGCKEEEGSGASLIDYEKAEWSGYCVSQFGTCGTCIFAGSSVAANLVGVA